jgi:phosphate starvation-inducible protein PhoH
MAKQRTLARRPRDTVEHRRPEEESNVRALFGWSPLGVEEGEDAREQRFMRHVKPRSAGQQQLMEAIDTHPRSPRP